MPPSYYADADILKAVKQGDMELLGQMREQGIDFCQVSGALCAAASAGSAAALRFLLDFGYSHSDDMRFQPGDPSALFAAAMSGHADCVAVLLPFCPPGESNFFGHTPQVAAAQNGHAECLRLLTPALNPDFPSFRRPKNDSGVAERSDLTRAALAAASAGQTECLRLLAPLFSSMDFRDAGATLLGEAAAGNRPEAIDFLLNYFDAREADAKGNSPLHRAVLDDSHEALAALLPHSEPNRRNLSQARPLDLAIGHSRLECVRLLAPATDLSAFCGSSKETPLGAAAAYGNADIVRVLLPLSDPDSVDHERSTPLMAALLGGHSECARILADRSDVERKNAHGQSPLDIAFDNAPWGGGALGDALGAADAIAARLSDGAFELAWSQRADFFESRKESFPRIFARREAVLLRAAAQLPEPPSPAEEPSARPGASRRL